MPIDRIIFIIYGLFLLVGAFFGWKAGSKVSLYMGISSGILVLIGVYLSLTNTKLGYTFLAIVSGLLVGVFIIRFLKTHQLMPAGMLLIVSLIALVTSIRSLCLK